MKIFLSTLGVAVLIALAFFMVSGSGKNAGVADGKNVSIENGKQIIDLNVRGGYTPVKSVAKAGMPTVIRFTANGVYDCSSFVRIPSMSIGKSLASTGQTEIDLGNPKAGILRGSCGMGMYPFEINFQS